MRVLLFDKDFLFLNHLQSMIHSFFYDRHITCPEILSFDTDRELLSHCQDTDIVFLDICQTEDNELLTLQRLKITHPAVLVFVITAHIENLDKAIQCQVFRCMKKPITIEQLTANLRDALKVRFSTDPLIALETKECTYTICASDIIYIDSCARKVCMHTMSGNYTSLHPLKYWINQLPPHLFGLSHQSFLVNYKYVKHFDHALVYLKVNNDQIHISRRRYTLFKNGHRLYLESMKGA